MGTKRSLLTEGNGVPLAVAVAGANRNDLKLAPTGIGSKPVLPQPVRFSARQTDKTGAVGGADLRTVIHDLGK